MNSDKFIYGLAVLFISATQIVLAQTEQPNYKLLNRIAACNTIRCIKGNESATKLKIEQIVLDLKWLMIDPLNLAAAKGLLESIPTTEQEEMYLFTLSYSHEGVTTSMLEMKRLDRIYSAWPRLLGKAVQLWPEFLPAYIRYGRLAIMDAHSDYTGYEQRVCRADPNRFQSALLTLSKEDQKYALKYVFDPSGCRPIFISEAD